MISMFSIQCIVLVLAVSIALLGLSIYKYAKTCLTSKRCGITRNWAILVVLLSIFILGYIAVIVDFVVRWRTSAETPSIWLVVIAILFLGAIYSVISSNLFQSVVSKVTFEKNELQQYIDSVHEIILSLDKDAKIEMINPYGAQLLGYKEKQLIGRDWINACIPARMREEIRYVFEELRQGKVKNVENYENEVLTREHNEIVVSWHNTVIYDENGKFIRIISAGRDLPDGLATSKPV